MSKSYKFTVRSRRIQVFLDKILLLRLLKRIHGRYWGIYGLLMMSIAFTICFIIEPNHLNKSTALSDFGGDIRTVPYFIAGIFAGAYGLWRWRNYLARTFVNPGIITFLITLTIIGLYMVVFMPLGWNDTVEKLHYMGFALAGTSMALTVIADIALRKTRKTKKRRKWQIIRLFSLFLIVVGAIITGLSTNRVGRILELALVGELAIFGGYAIWVITKTYQGEGRKTGASKLLNKIIVVE